jgi:NADPH:quinone reductase-like Zn-dependent oxidoreductase
MLFSELAQRVSEGQLSPVAPISYPFEEVSKALRDLMERRVVGKAVLVCHSP